MYETVDVASQDTGVAAWEVCGLGGELRVSGGTGVVRLPAQSADVFVQKRAAALHKMP